MNKIISIIVFLLILPIVFSSKIDYLYHENNAHYYSVTFDEEGEASVTARLSFQNTGETPIKSIRLEIPGYDARIINILQEYYPQELICAEYDYNYKPSNRLRYKNVTSYSPKYTTLKYTKHCFT